MSKKVVESIKQGRPSKPESIFLTSGNTLRDLMLGGGTGMGYKCGNIYNVVGSSSAGKTFVALQGIVANHYKLGDTFVWNYDDCEEGFTFDVDAMYGMEVPIIGEDTRRSQTVEDLYVNVRKFSDSLKKDQVGMYIVDSLDALVSKDTVDRGDERVKAHDKEKEFDVGTYGAAKQKFLSSEFFPDVASRIKDTNIVLVIISQVRDKFNAGLYGKKETRSGGRALQFYCHTVEWLSVGDRKEMVTKSGLRAGVPIASNNNEKSKTKRPARSIYMVLDYSIGIDDIAGNIDFLYDLRTDAMGKLRGTIKKKIEWDGELYSREELCNYIYDNQLEAELKQRVVDKWEERELEVINPRKVRFV